tara:strand:- start:4557 stop:5318 length:762 start_codon:yes stop_codon:yes gene_type:complete
MAENLIWVAILLAGAWFLLSRRASAGSGDSDSGDTPSSRPKKLCKGNADGLALEEQREIDRALRERTNAQSEARKEILEDQRSRRDAREKIERAKTVIKKAGLSDDLADLWDKVKYWPNWMTLPQGYELPEGFTTVAGYESDNREEKSTCWTWENTFFEIKYVSKPNYTPDHDWNPCDLHLSVNDEEVVVLNYNQGSREYGHGLRFVGVDALNIGPWMSQIVRMVAALKATSDKRLRERWAESEAEKAARIKL